MGRCIHGVRVDDSAAPLCQQCEALSDADYRADDMIDKVFGYLATRPERYSRQDVLTAMHEWLKSQLVILGVPTNRK